MEDAVMVDEQRAEELKNKGNEEFKNGKHQQAIEYYSEAICNLILNDPLVLSRNEGILTNRAAAYIQLKK